jgi:hypothetical protein
MVLLKIQQLTVSYRRFFGFDKNRGAIFGRRGAARDGPERSGGRAAVPGREQSHPLRHFIFSRFNGLPRAPFSTAKLLPNSGDSRGRITICGMRFVAAFIAEIAIRETRSATRAAGLFSIACLIA